MRRWFVVAMGIMGFLLLVGGARRGVSAAVAVDSLDLRVDSLTSHMLLNLPAEALVDPQRQHAAQLREKFVLPGKIAVYVLAAIALLWFWRSGSAARLRDSIRRSIRSEWIVRAMFSASAALLVRLAELPAQFYLYRVDRSMDLTSSLTPVWFLNWLVVTLAWMLCAAVALSILLWLADRSHMWYIPALAGVSGVVIIAFLSSGLIHPSKGKLNGDWPHIIGVGPTLRVVVPVSFTKVATPGELRFALARMDVERDLHVPAHRLMLVLILVLVAMSAAVGVADRIAFRRDDDPLTRVIVAAIVLALLALPAHMLYAGYTRSDSLKVDHLAELRTQDLPAAIRLLVREADRDLEPLRLTPLELPFSDGHEPIAIRIHDLRSYGVHPHG